MSHCALIDGGNLEGGGQLLRNTVSLSALLSLPITVENIRHGRSQPGLRSQHAVGIRLAADICSAETEGVEEKSTKITFVPNALRHGQFRADAITAGATSLLLQVSLPILLFSGKPDSPSTLTLLGGTNALNAPQIDYVQNVFVPFMRRHFSISGLDIRIERRGYYPKGGGKVTCTIPGLTGPLPAISLLDRGEVTSIRGLAHVAGIPASLAQQMAASAAEKLISAGVDSSLIQIQAVREKNENTAGAGSGIVLFAETNTGCYFGGSALGSKGKDPGLVGLEAANELASALEEGGAVDHWLQDQIIIFMALAHGRSSVRVGKEITLHTKTAIWIAESLTGVKFELIQSTSGHFTIQCNGIGYSETSPRLNTSLDHGAP